MWANYFPSECLTEWNADVGVVPLQNNMVADVRTRLLILLGAVVLVLLIACANVANLMLSRAASRKRNWNSFRFGRVKRIVKAVVTESVVLAALGGLWDWHSPRGEFRY